jgi:outer membrane protein OmpA-like peptidoglycan-associated protein
LCTVPRQRPPPQEHNNEDEGLGKDKEKEGEGETMMKRKSGFWVLWTLALIGAAGCGMTQKQRNYAVAGGIAGGAVGAGIGSVAEGDDTRTGTAIGAGVGVLIGAVIGYWLAGEEPPPPPPPPARPTPPPPPPPPPAPAVSKRIVLRGINFDFNKANIKREFAPVLDEAAQILTDNPSVRVTVEGHTDSIGSDSYNQRLSERRANAVKQYLVSRGVMADRLETVGKGEKEPVAPNTTPNGKDNPEGRAMNRRAELKVH